MNPEEIQALLAEVAAARADGMSDREINAAFRRYKVPFDNVRTLERVALNMGVPLPTASQEAGGGVREAISDVVAPFLQGATMSLGSDFLEGMERAGLVREGAGERNRDRVQQARERHPIRSILLQGAGSVVGAPRAVAQSLLTPVVRGVGALAGRAGAAAARAAGAGPMGQLGARGAANVVGATAAGAGAGAAEGGLIGFGEAYGQEDRGGSAATGALFGGVTGGILSSLGSTVGNIRGVRREIKRAGDELAGTAERVAAGLPTRRGVAAAVDEADAARRAGQKAVSGFGIAPARAESLFLTNPTIYKTLRRSGSERARQVVRELDAVRSGKSDALPEISFDIVDDVRNDLKATVDAFAKRLPDATGRVPSNARAREAEEALEVLDEILQSDVPGFAARQSATAAARSMERAYETGRRLANQPLDVVEDVFAGKVVRRGRQRIRLQNTPENNAAARAGLAEPILTRLRSGQEAAASFIKELETSGELQGRMRIILGSDEAYESFIREANHLRALSQADKVAESLVKWAGFVGFGSSVLGGTISSGLLSP